eukprot:1642930-Prymnesium_polylepis.1
MPSMRDAEPKMLRARLLDQAPKRRLGKHIVLKSDLHRDLLLHLMPEHAVLCEERGKLTPLAHVQRQVVELQAAFQ